MRAVLIRRFLMMLVVLLLVSLVIFAITELLPGDVARSILGQWATPEDLRILRVKYGLDRPAYIRYLEWMRGFVTGNWGISPRLDVPIASLLLTRLGNSAILGLLALAVITPVSILLGVIAGLKANRWPDRVISITTLFFMAMPEFVSGVFLILVFSWWLKLLPATSFMQPGASPINSPQLLIMPTITLTLVLLAYIGRMTRSSMIDTLQAPYVRTAFLKGLPYWTVVIRHALRNALVPTVTVISNQIGWLIGGLVVVESLFAYPGIGFLLYESILTKDIMIVESAAMLVATVYVVSNFIADMLYIYLNPRIRYE